MPEKLSSFERVIGALGEKKRMEILSGFRESFDEKKLRGIQEYEIPKTPKDLAVINLTNEASNDIRRKYGFSDFNVSPGHIVIVEELHWDWGDDGDNAYFSPSRQLIATPHRGENFAFARVMFHEMLHCKSFGSLRVLRGGRKMVDDRIGLRTRTRKGRKYYFENLDEAVVETLTMKFIAALFQNKDPRFAREIKAMETVGINPENIEKGIIFGYEQGRMALNTLVDKINKRNVGAFDSREEVFAIFVKSLFSRNLLAVGRLIDTTFGGGTFRKIGKLDSNPEKLLQFVCDL